MRERMEAAFDHDFRHVRVHTDGDAAQASADLQAHAFALGAHVFFGSGTFAPGTPAGDRLLLHELTHVVQHDEGRIPSDGPSVSSPSDPLEQEAYTNEVALQGALLAADVDPGSFGDVDFGLPVAVELGRAPDATSDARVAEDIDAQGPAFLQGKHERKPRLELDLAALQQLAQIADEKHAPRYATNGELMEAILAYQDQHAEDLVEHQPVDAEQREDWDVVRDQAVEALPAFSEIVQRLIADTHALTGVGGGDTKHTKAPKAPLDDPSLDPGRRSMVRRAHKAAVKRHNASPVQYVQNDKELSGTAGLKAKGRSDQKAAGKYGGRYDRLLDIVRGTLTFHDFGDLMDAMRVIWDKRLDYGYDIQRCKQTYLADPANASSRHRTLYGDVKLNLVEGKTRHVCELQLTIEAMWEAKIGGHRPYEQYRDANPFDKKIGDLVGNDQRSAKAAVRASQGAYGNVRSKLERDENYCATIALAEQFSAFVANKGPAPDGFE